MAKSLKNFTENHIQEPFTWIGRDGNYDPHQMRTGHLFNTISMVWNHAMPEQYRTHNYNRYAFGPRHTPDYMFRAVRIMLPILLRRADLTAFQLSRLEYMRNCLLRNPHLTHEDSKTHEQSQSTHNDSRAISRY